MLSKRHTTQTVKLTAGLHRQTWISGYLIFVDMHIVNRSSKDVKKVELQLEKTTLFHNYTAPSTSAGLADVLRLPDHRQTEIVVRKDLGDGFQGVHSLSEDFRTCQLALPTGLVSVETGVCFGSRFHQCKDSCLCNTLRVENLWSSTLVGKVSAFATKSLTALHRAILWHSILLEYSNHLLFQVCLPCEAFYQVLAYS